ncbi:hypothetical protein G9A89_007351 [Geosiphon pyriformis]|nr:hypothetical protein G9A89_007351 [Geosiphon pyriformis]
MAQDSIQAYKLLWDEETTSHYLYSEVIPKIQLNGWTILKEQPLQTSMMMNTSSKSLVATFKAPLLPGFYKKPMLVLNKKLLNGLQQILEKTTPLSLLSLKTNSKLPS